MSELGIACRQRHCDDFQQPIRRAWFGKKVDVGPAKVFTVGVSGDHNGRPSQSGGGQFLQQFNPRHSRQTNVDDQEFCLGDGTGLQELFGTTVRNSRIPTTIDQRDERIAYRHIVINDANDWLGSSVHAASFRGSVMRKVAPRSLACAPVKRPEWAMAMERLIARPIPIPSGLVV